MPKGALTCYCQDCKKWTQQPVTETERELWTSLRGEPIKHRDRYRECSICGACTSFIEVTYADLNKLVTEVLDLRAFKEQQTSEDKNAPTWGALAVWLGRLAAFFQKHKSWPSLVTAKEAVLLRQVKAANEEWAKATGEAS